MAARREKIHHRAEALAAPLPALLVAAQRIAATVSHGIHGRRRPGTGETFWQYRRYQPDDPAQLVDWRQSARSQTLFVRESEWEAAQSLWLWRDASASMAYRSSRRLPSKGERADLLALALAALLLRGGERVALLGAGMRPVSGRAALAVLAQRLESLAQTSSLPAPEQLPRHARVVLISDFLVPLEKLRAAVGALAARNPQGHLLQALDPAEETLPFVGRTRFEGPEGEGSLLVGRAESLRDDYQDAVAAHRRGLEALARNAGWTFAVHHTNHAPEAPLLALFMALSERREGV